MFCNLTKENIFSILLYFEEREEAEELRAATEMGNIFSGGSGLNYRDGEEEEEEGEDQSLSVLLCGIPVFARCQAGLPQQAPALS